MRDIRKSPFYNHTGSNQFRQESSVMGKPWNIRTVTEYHSISLQITYKSHEGRHLYKAEMRQTHLNQITKFNVTQIGHLPISHVSPSGIKDTT